MNSKGDILASMLRNYKDCHFFLHNTRDVNVVERIMNEGFIFESQLSNSTDCVNPAVSVEITYFLYQRKEYGKYTVVIAIPNRIFESYVDEAFRCDVCIEYILSAIEPYLSENEEFIYTIPPQHILGYFDIEASEFSLNSRWDPLYSK